MQRRHERVVPRLVLAVDAAGARTSRWWARERAAHTVEQVGRRSVCSEEQLGPLTRRDGNLLAGAEDHLRRVGLHVRGVPAEPVRAKRVRSDGRIDALVCGMGLIDVVKEVEVTATVDVQIRVLVVARNPCPLGLIKATVSHGP